MATYQELPPEPAGMGTGTKVLLGLSIGCGVVVLLCCGGVAGIGWLGTAYFKRAIDRDPDRVIAAANEIATLDIPATLRPEAAIDLHVPFTGQPIMSAAIFTGKRHNLLALGDFAGPFGSADQKQLQELIDEALTHRDPDEDERGGLRVSESQQFEVEINGQPAKFLIEQGEDEHSNEKQIRATGQFQGKKGTSLLILLLDADLYDQEKVEQILRSIH